MNAEAQRAAYDRLKAATSELPNAIGAYLDSLGADQAPSPESPAAAEVKAHGDREAGLTIKGQAWLLLEAAADNLGAIPRLLDEPSFLIAPFGCARSVLEESARVLWLMDGQIDSLE